MQRIQYSMIPILMTIALSLSVVQAKEVNIGMSAALTGPAQALGKGMKRGVEAYFKQINKVGVNGNRFKLIALDDGYEPSRAGQNMRQLIDQEKVLAVIGNVGTPTAIVSVPIANKKMTLLFGAFTGASILRKSPPDRYIINYRASYAEETAYMVHSLIASGIKAEEIAFFTQNDSYGNTAYKGAMKALKVQGVSHPEKLIHARYTRNTLNVENALGKILDSEIEPKAIIMVGTYAPCAKFIKLAKEDLPNIQFLNVSFVGSTELAKALGSQGDGVIVTQVVPHYNSNYTSVNEYRIALKAYDSSAKPDFISLEGYLVAKLFIEGVKNSGSNPSRESIIDALEALSTPNIDIGSKISLSKIEHQASHQLWPTKIKQGQFVVLKWPDI